MSPDTVLAPKPSPFPILFDRSRHETYQHCPRERFWGYEYRGQGIQRVLNSIPLLTGSLIHEPLSQVLKHGPGRMEDAIRDARERYQLVVSTQGLLSDSFDGSEEMYGAAVKAVNWQVEEQLAILEALTRGWVKLRYPALVAEFDIIDVEREERFEFPPVALYDQPLVLMTRSDALLRRKGSGELFVLNFKSTSEPNIIWQQQWQYDSQTISEVLAIEKRLNEVVSGVIVEGLVKGKRNIQHPKDSGQWRHNSPLIYGWKQDGLPAPIYEARYEYKDSMTGQTRRLGKGFSRFFVPEEMPLPAWLEKLDADCPDVLRAQFINLPAILRSEWQVKRWIESAHVIEQNIRALREMHGKGTMTLDQTFPMHTSHGNCLRPSRCQFFELCHGMQSPDDSSLFMPRKANHPELVEKEVSL